VKGGRVIPEDLFAKARLAPAGKPLTVFRAELIGREEAGWEDLFAGFTTLTTPFGESASTQVGMRRPSIEFAREKKGDRSSAQQSAFGTEEEHFCNVDIALFAGDGKSDCH
jgi:hypothetical protein